MEANEIGGGILVPKFDRRIGGRSCYDQISIDINSVHDRDTTGVTFEAMDCWFVIVFDIPNDAIIVIRSRDELSLVFDPLDGVHPSRMTNECFYDFSGLIML